MHTHLRQPGRARIRLRAHRLQLPGGRRVGLGLLAHRRQLHLLRRRHGLQAGPGRQQGAHLAVGRQRAGFAHAFPGTGPGAGFFDGAPEHGALHRPPVDSAPGQEQSHAGLCAACGHSLSQWALHGAHAQLWRRRVNGDLTAAVAAVLLDSEARTSAAPLVAEKLREPVLMMTGAVRALNGSTDGEALSWWWGDAMRQHVFYSPSVFNFYSPSLPGARAHAWSGRPLASTT
jgi:hypothetical protein